MTGCQWHAREGDTGEEANKRAAKADNDTESENKKWQQVGRELRGGHSMRPNGTAA